MPQERISEHFGGVEEQWPTGMSRHSHLTARHMLHTVTTRAKAVT